MNRRRSSAFALLLVLGIVALVGASMVGLAHESLTGAVEVQQRIKTLQQRWAVTSCQLTLLSQAPNLLSNRTGDQEGREAIAAGPAGADGDMFVTERRFELRLSGARYTVVATDEQAKLNVNRLVEWSGRAAAQRIVGRMARGPARSGVGPLVSLRPLSGGTGRRADLGLSPIGSYQQVFNTNNPQQLIGESTGMGVAARITCWGDGRLNIRRAPDELVEGVGQPLLRGSQIHALLEARRQLPNDTVQAWLDQVDTIDDDQRKALAGRMTDASRCFGLWVIGHHGPRRSYSFAVAEAGVSANDSSAAPTIAHWSKFVW